MMKIGIGTRHKLQKAKKENTRWIYLPILLNKIIKFFVLAGKQLNPQILEFQNLKIKEEQREILPIYSKAFDRT